MSEHETRTFLITPLLVALGWSEQRIKIEWDKLDVALFRYPHGYKEKGQPLYYDFGVQEAMGGALLWGRTSPICRREVPLMLRGCGIRRDLL